MAAHYVYDDPDKTQLAQGDVLQRTDALVGLLNHYHPRYAEYADYKFFAVLTQSCDLVRRDDKPPQSPYITIAAARTLAETLLCEVAKTQHEWQRRTKVIGSRESSFSAIEARFGCEAGFRSQGNNRIGRATHICWRAISRSLWFRGRAAIDRGELVFSSSFPAAGRLPARCVMCAVCPIPVACGIPPPASDITKREKHAFRLS